jgi:hypothetical protein
MNEKEGRWRVPTGEEINAEGRDSRGAGASRSWVQKLKLRAHIGARRRILQPPPLKPPQTAKPAGGSNVMHSAPSGPSSTPSTSLSPPSTDTTPRTRRSSDPAPPKQVGPSVAPASPAPERPSASVAKRRVRINQDALSRRSGRGPGDDLGTPASTVRVLIDGRCSACGRSFHGGVERATVRFVGHECGGRKVDDEWRFDK